MPSPSPIADHLTIEELEDRFRSCGDATLRAHLQVVFLRKKGRNAAVEQLQGRAHPVRLYRRQLAEPRERQLLRLGRAQSHCRERLPEVARRQLDARGQLAGHARQGARDRTALARPACDNVSRFEPLPFCRKGVRAEAGL
jgi:hypothetical protein